MPTDFFPDGHELATILDQLAAAIARVGQGMRNSDGTSEKWSDATSVYVDVKIPELAGERLDICLHDGRLFVVLERP